MQIQKGPEQRKAWETRPTAVTATMSYPAGPGIEVSHAFTEVVTLSAALSGRPQLMDIGTQLRLTPIGGRTGAFYVAGGPSLVVAPNLAMADGAGGKSSPVLLGVSGEVGGEYRGMNGVTFGAGVGGVILHQIGGATTVVPTVTARLGYAF